MEQYSAFLKLPKEQREQQEAKEPKKPFCHQLLVSDFTPEALVDVLKYNRRGIGVYADELAAWLNNFNRYNKGSEEQFWLSNWSGTTIRTNRKGGDPNFIEMPFASVCGTIQPGVISELLAGKKDNGFTDRILFAVPENLKKEYWSVEELDAQVERNWQTIADRLLNMPLRTDDNGDVVPRLLNFTPAALTHLRQWQAEMTDAANGTESDDEAGIYAKLETYAARLALCLELLSYGCNESQAETISIESVKRALQLVEYFRRTALGISRANAEPKPLRKLSKIQKAVYTALPETFTTGEGVTLAEGVGMPERTFKDFLNNKELFDKLKQGQYKKLF